MCIIVLPSNSWISTWWASSACRYSQLQLALCLNVLFWCIAALKCNGSSSGSITVWCCGDVGTESYSTWVVVVSRRNASSWNVVESPRAWFLDEETVTLGGSFAVYSEKSFAGCPLSSHAALVSTQPGKDWWTTQLCSVKDAMMILYHYDTAS